MVDLNLDAGRSRDTDRLVTPRALGRVGRVDRVPVAGLKKGHRLRLHEN